MLQEALDNWGSPQLMQMRGVAVVVYPAELKDHADPTILYGPAAQVARAMILLSLFDGTGMARVGLDAILRMANAREVPVASFFAERDPRLAGAMERRW
eukprot:1601949-Lingulodinium_polyedra.AAC.1